MPASIPAASIPHAAGCKRPAPTLRLSWKQEPETWCPGCGRATVLNNPFRPTPTEKETTR